MDNLFLTLLDNPAKRKNSLLLLLDMIPFGHHPLPYIERIEQPVERALLRDGYAESLNEMKLKYDFHRYIRKSSQNLDLETGAFLISRLSENTEITPEKFTYELDSIAGSLLEAMKTSPLSSLEMFSKYLFQDGKFSGSEMHLSNPESFFLTEVLKNGWGNPVSLSILAILFGKRTGIVFQGISLPGYFLLKTKHEGCIQYLDPLNRGRILNREEFELFLKERRLKIPNAGNSEISNLLILKRMYRNLMHYHSSEGNFQMEMTLRQYFTILEDSSLSH